MIADSANLAIETAGLTKVFRDFWGQQRVVAVDRLDLEVRTQEVFGLLGPNGSGKSTTIKLLLGLLFSTHGVARVLGRPPGDVKTNARIGYLPEESHLYPFLNARETLDFYGRLFGLERSQRRARTESLLEMVGLSSVARRPVGEFSKGMARRIGLAQALINDPDLLILDEPTSGLDPIGTRQIKDLIRELGQRGKTVLLCSHLLADVEDVCDRICILYGGRPQALGAVNDLLARGEMTQISTTHLDAQAVEEVKAAILARHADAEVAVDTPRIRLEDFFLNTVEQAQAAAASTSGAVMGTGVSDFLRGPEAEPDSSEALLDQLVAGTDRDATAAVGAASTEVETTPVEPIDTTDRGMLDSLVDASADAAAAGAGAPGLSAAATTPVNVPDAPDPQVSAEQVDHSLLDELTGTEADSAPETDAKNKDPKDGKQKEN